MHILVSRKGSRVPMVSLFMYVCAYALSLEGSLRLCANEFAFFPVPNTVILIYDPQMFTKFFSELMG